MQPRKRFAAVSALILIFAAMLAAPAARADEWNQATQLTFNQPMEIPGHKILAAGTYWFVTMADLSVANDNVVQIFDASRRKIIATLISDPIQRRTVTDRTEVNLAKQQGNEPNLLVSWFYPGSHIGHQFVYGREEDKVVAADPHTKVMASPGGSVYGD